MEVYANNIKVPFRGVISLKFFNPLFNDIGSHSFPISFSGKIPAVNKAFGFPINAESPDAGYIPARIKSGIIDLIGSWQVNESQGNDVEAYYKGSSGDFYSMIKDKLLTGLEFGGLHYPAGENAQITTTLAYMTTKMDAVYPDNDWTAFMAYMPNVVGGFSMEVNPITHDDETGIPRFTNPIAGHLNSTVYLFAGTIIDYIFAEYGYRVERNIFREDQDLQRVVVFNTFNRMPVMTGPGIGVFDYKKLVPRVLISDFLKALRNKFNIGFFINEQSRSVKILSFDSIIAAGPAAEKLQVSLPRINKKKITGLSFGVTPPDTWSTNNFSSEAELDPDGTLLLYHKYNDLSTAGITDKIAYVRAESTYYKVDSLGVITRIGPALFPYSEEDGTTVIEQKSGTLGMYTLKKTFETDVEYIIPYCDLTSNAGSYPYTDFPLIFLIARGTQDCQVYPIYGSFGRQYPMGTSDLNNAKGYPITGATLALRWDGTNGIIDRFWANRNNWELNDKKIITTSLLGQDLAKLLDFSRIIRAGESNYWINSLNVELSNKVIRITEAELFRL